MTRAAWLAAWVLFGAGGCSSTGPATGGAEVEYRMLPLVCLPCGDERSVVLASPEELDALYVELEERCGDSSEAASWRERVESADVDLGSEALLILWDVIGTGGAPSLVVDEPSSGLLTAEIRWTVPEGPARPVATAACFCFAVDRSSFSGVEVKKGPTVVLSRSF